MCLEKGRVIRKPALERFIKFALIPLILIQAAPSILAQQTFVNPIIAHGADPSVEYVNGMYYSVASACPRLKGTPSICVRAAKALPELGKTAPVVIWSAPTAGPNAKDLWAPQIRFFDGKWYVYYAADPDDNRHHALFALTPKREDQPLGEWQEADTGSPSGGFTLDWKSAWAIDPDVFRASDGHFYLLFACRQDNTNTREGNFQSICISAMSDPLHVMPDASTGKKVIELSLPTQAWERRVFPTQEGPFGFTHNGVDYILYSASFSGTPDDYAEGLLINRHPPVPRGRNPLMDPAAWTKEGPVFDGHHASYGTASSVLVPSQDGTELWHVYHGTDCIHGCALRNNMTWQDRSDRAQRAGWSAQGEFVLGYPVDIADTDGTGEAVPLRTPSTDGTGSTDLPSWGAAFGDAAEGKPQDGQAKGEWQVEGRTLSALKLDDTGMARTFFYANPNLQNYVVYTKMRVDPDQAMADDAAAGVYAAYVDHDNFFSVMLGKGSCGAALCIITAGRQSGREISAASCSLPPGFAIANEIALAVESVAGTFNIFVNDEPAAGTCNGRHAALREGQSSEDGSNGQAGVLVSRVKAQFDDFTMSPGVPVDSDKNSILFSFSNRSTSLLLTSSCGKDGCGTKASHSGATIDSEAADAPYPLTASPLQVWRLTAIGVNAFAISNVFTELCLTEDDHDSGRHVLSSTKCGHSAAETWRLLPVAARSSFILQNAKSGSVISASGREVQLKLRTGTPSEHWQLLQP